MERIYYKPIMKSGEQFQVYIPKEIIRGLELKNRDEVKITIEKTGRIVEISNRFGHKKDTINKF